MSVALDTALAPIADIAADLGLLPDEFATYGRHAAKIELAALDRRLDQPDGRLVCVTAVTPTRFGEGKTTTAISLTEALGVIGERAVLCIREPSLGPVFGIKGGGTGGGRAQVVPMETINLHFTGDLHAIAAANNLLAAMLEAHLFHGNALGIDPLSVTWKRCLDVNDRALRRTVVGLGGRLNGLPRETGFDITAASEVMAVVAMAGGVEDLRERLGAITVGETVEGEPVTAEALGAAGAMASLLVETLKPNLVQTLEGRPALVHCGPFANIAHGNNSVLADRLGLKLGDYVVTESGFGADMGFEKLIDIVCRSAGLVPSVAVVVATTQALKHHGGDPAGGIQAIERGSANLAAHLGVVQRFGLPCVVAVNRFPGDDPGEIEAVRGLALELGATAAELNEGYEEGGEGAVALAEAVVRAASTPAQVDFLYSLDDSIEEKIAVIATQAYGAAGVELMPAAQAAADRLVAAGLGRLPVCMAKTHLSLSHDPALIGAPEGFVLPVRELRPYTGAGWIVALCGEMQTMPGLSASPAALGIDVEPGGAITGLR